MHSLEALIEDFKNHLKAENNLSSYADRLKTYQGEDWQRYVAFTECCYHREIVYQCDEFEFIVISWKQGQGSQIHDHPGQGCLMTILKGELIEKTYEINNQSQILSYLHTSNLSVGKVGYKQGHQGLHQIEAPVECVSLHIYRPSRYQAKLYTCTTCADSTPKKSRESDSSHHIE